MANLRLFAVASILALGGCASQWTVDRYEAPEANLAARHAFFLKGGELSAPVAPDPADAARVEAAIRGTITTELGRKGYAEVTTAGAADLIVSYQIAGSRRFVIADNRRIGAPSPNTVLSPSAIQPPPLSTVPREQTIRDGSVIVFAADPATGKLIWRGLITSETRIGSTEDLVRLVENMTRAILAEFPARAGQPAK